MKNSVEHAIGFVKRHRGITITAGVLIVLVLLIEAGSFAADAWLLHYARQKLNTFSPDFSGEIRAVTTHPFALSLDVRGIVVTQKAYADKPVARIPVVQGKIGWFQLFRGRIIASARVVNPRFDINREHLERAFEKAAKPAPVKETWQEQLKRLPAAALRDVTVENAEVSYGDLMVGKEPVKITGMDIDLRNISDRPQAGGKYPFEIHLDGLVAGSGRITVQGQADVLSETLPVVQVDFSMKNMDISRFRTTAKQYSLDIKKGVVSVRGRIEYSSERKMIDIRQAVLDGPDMDYIHVAQPAREKPEPKEKNQFVITADSVRIIKGNFGIVNKSSEPTYRISMSDMDMDLENFSTGFNAGPARLKITGQFMNSGDTLVTGTFRPEQDGPDFSLNIAIRNTEMPEMNNLFRAYGKFDVAQGVFSFYSQLAVRDNKVEGYVKPLFRDMKVYDKRTDKEKSEFHKLYEKVVGGVAHLLENRPRKAVATEAPVKGNVINPKLGTWDAVVNLVQNAFFQAILPGFEQNIQAG